MTVNDALKENVLLRGCPNDALLKIEPLIDRVSLQPGVFIFHEGEPADAMYLVLNGAVSLSRKGANARPEAVAVVRAGDFFGDLAALGDELHAVQAMVIEPAVLGRIEAADLLEMLRLAPEVLPLNLVRACLGHFRGYRLDA